ncbi:MAG: hypothetical protein JW843_07295 [Candidatus Aminicenantes bacterium]|nr:hypothetical protein [Candidatus Aminicenantes bacterium]
MMDLVKRLADRERRIVSILAAVFGSIVILLVVFGVRARLDAGRAAARRASIEAEWRTADRDRKAALAQWNRWVQAETDLQELGGKWFYDRAEGIGEIRADLREVLAKAGVAAMDFEYGETEIVRGRLRRVTVRFAWGGAYPAFRRLLEIVENHPRSLNVARIEFRNIGGTPGYVEAGIVLEGYAAGE